MDPARDPATDPAFNFNAYAYLDHDGSTYLTLINKSYGAKALSAAVSLQLPPNTGAGTWQQMELTQGNQNIAAKTDITLGDAAIDAQGNWSGQWKQIEGSNANTLTVQVAPASAIILHFSPAK